MEENHGATSSGLGSQIMANSMNDENSQEDNQSVTAILSVKPLGALLWSLFSGVMYGAVAFAFMALIVYIIAGEGILATVNSLLGEAMQLSESKLYALSGMLAIVITVFTSLLKWLNYMLYNASSRLLGPVKTIIEIEEYTNTGKNKTHVNSMKVPGSVHSAINGEVKR